MAHKPQGCPEVEALATDVIFPATHSSDKHDDHYDHDDEKDGHADNHAGRNFLSHVIGGKLTGCELHQRCGGLIKALIKIALAEVRVHLVLANVSRGNVRDDTFQTIAGSNGCLAIVDGHQHHHTVVLSFLTHTPHFADAIGIVHHVVTAQVFYDHHGNLCCCCVVVCIEFSFKGGFIRCAQHTGKVVNQLRRDGYRWNGLGSSSRYQQKQRNKSSYHAAIGCQTKYHREVRSCRLV